MSTKVAVIGAGNVGGNLGSRLASAGIPVQFGMKEGSDPAALLARAKGASAATPAAAASWADIVFFALPGPVVLDVVRSLSKELSGKIVVDCNNPVTWKDGPVWNPPPEGSLAAAIAKAVPSARVVKGFNTFGAEFHLDPNHAGVPAQVMLASDDAEAKKAVSEVASQAGFRPIDAGPLRNAAALENHAILWMHLAIIGGHGRDFTFVMQKRGGA
jgi:NADPH-dependent F420 reductase